MLDFRGRFSTVAREIDRGEYDRYLKQFEIHSKWTSPNAEQ
jgi:hypothetical protein